MRELSPIILVTKPPSGAQGECREDAANYGHPGHNAGPVELSNPRPVNSHANQGLWRNIGGTQLPASSTECRKPMPCLIEGAGTRTRDLRIKSPLLYQLSYASEAVQKLEYERQVVVQPRRRCGRDIEPKRTNEVAAARAHLLTAGRTGCPIERDAGVCPRRLERASVGNTHCHARPAGP
jgi:hypothetical protein